MVEGCKGRWMVVEGWKGVMGGGWWWKGEMECNGRWVIRDVWSVMVGDKRCVECDGG